MSNVSSQWVSAPLLPDVRVPQSMWLHQCGCSDSESENFTLLTVHTPETVTSMTPRGALTEIHLLCSTRWGAFSVSVVVDDVESFLYVLEDVRAHLQNQT